MSDLFAVLGGLAVFFALIWAFTKDAYIRGYAEAERMWREAAAREADRVERANNEALAEHEKRVAELTRQHEEREKALEELRIKAENVSPDSPDVFTVDDVRTLERIGPGSLTPGP